MKKFISTITAIALILSVFTFTAFAEAQQVWVEVNISNAFSCCNVNVYPAGRPNEFSGGTQWVMLPFVPSTGTFWKLDSTAYVCQRCGGNEWVTTSNNSGNPDGKNPQLTHCNCDFTCHNDCPSNNGCTPRCGVPCNCDCVCVYECVCECEYKCDACEECEADEDCAAACIKCTLPTGCKKDNVNASWTCAEAECKCECICECKCPTIPTYDCKCVCKLTCDEEKCVGHGCECKCKCPTPNLTGDDEIEGGISFFTPPANNNPVVNQPLDVGTPLTVEDDEIFIFEDDEVPTDAIVFFPDDEVPTAAIEFPEDDADANPFTSVTAGLFGLIALAAISTTTAAATLKGKKRD